MDIKGSCTLHQKVSKRVNMQETFYNKVISAFLSTSSFKCNHRIKTSYLCLIKQPLFLRKTYLFPIHGFPLHVCVQ